MLILIVLKYKNDIILLKTITFDEIVAARACEMVIQQRRLTRTK